MEQIIGELTSTASIAIALFGIAFSLMQSTYSPVRRSFALFLIAVVANNLPDALSRVIDELPARLVQGAELIIWSPSSLCLAPLFWIYVHRLTSPSQDPPMRMFRHLLLPGIAVFIGLVIALASQDVRDFIFADQSQTAPSWALILIFAYVLVHLAVFPQIAIYLVLIVRRLLRHRTLLRDYYASTEVHELRWIYVIGGLGGLFWAAAVLIQVLVVAPDQTPALAVVLNLANLIGLVLVAAMTLWGLRQRPPLVPDTFDDTPPDEPTTAQSGKYQKSALSAEASTRIARKLRAAMEQDHLHRDANLSLWALARHIGASPNYISQTLSEVIGESFFDFVNGYRIAEAKTLLATTDGTVLEITFDVGFNARSSFYNAFKRATGQTPTSYRKTLSHPVGLDDTGP